MMTAFYLDMLTDFSNGGYSHLYDAVLPFVYLSAIREGINITTIPLPVRPASYTERTSSDEPENRVSRLGESATTYHHDTIENIELIEKRERFHNEMS